MEYPREIDQLVLVYGTLLSGYQNHNWCIKPYLNTGEAEFVDIFETEPEYNMISMGSFPAVLKKGSTSIKGELYRLKSEDALETLNSLEGHVGKDSPYNFYNITEVETPYGEALMYIIDDQGSITTRDIIKSGNWRTK